MRYRDPQDSFLVRHPRFAIFLAIATSIGSILVFGLPLGPWLTGAALFGLFGVLYLARRQK